MERITQCIRSRMATSKRIITVSGEQVSSDDSTATTERLASMRISSGSIDSNEGGDPSSSRCLQHQETVGDGDETKQPRRNVNFDSIRIREFGRALGDNPSTTHGPPLTLDWEFQDTEPVKVDEYELTRPPRRITQQMMIPGNVRENILLSQTETTKKQIASMVSQIRSSRHQRQTCVAMQDFEEWHELFEFVTRRFRRFRKGITKEREQELLWEKAQQIQREKEQQQQGNETQSQEDAVSDDTIDYDGL